MYEEFGLTVEDVMRMPFTRFMALQNLAVARRIRDTNKARRQQWSEDIAREG